MSTPRIRQRLGWLVWVSPSELAARGRDFLVLEAGARVGGVIRSARVEGHLLDWGPQRTRLTDVSASAALELASGPACQPFIPQSSMIDITASRAASLSPVTKTSQSIGCPIFAR